MKKFRRSGRVGKSKTGLTNGTRERMIVLRK